MIRVHAEVRYRISLGVSVRSRFMVEFRVRVMVRLWLG